MFPEAKLSEIRDTLIQCGSLELAAEKLSEKADSACTCVQSDTCMDASRILRQLKLKMKGYSLAETGLSLRAGGRGFPPATQSMVPGYFRR